MTKQALKNPLVTVQEVGIVYAGLGLLNQLMLVFLGTAMLPMELDASVQIQQQGECASQDSTVQMALVNPNHV